jgi:hypothetical protein
MPRSVRPFLEKTHESKLYLVDDQGFKDQKTNLARRLLNDLSTALLRFHS